MYNRKRILIYICLTIFVSGLITACESNDNQAPVLVENYLSAVVKQDGTQLRNLSCPDWEEQAIMEMDSFQAVKPELKDMQCALDSSTNAEYYVTCKGTIVTTYNDEQRNFELDRNIYRVIESGGELFVCGYKEP